MMNFSDVPKGWKVYILTWTWLGIAAGLASGAPLQDAFIIWAVGASAGWLLAATVRQKGWAIAAGNLAGALVTVVVALIVVGLLIGSFKPSGRVRRSGGFVNLPSPGLVSSEEPRTEHQNGLLRSCLGDVNKVFVPNLPAGANVKAERQGALDECFKTYGGYR